MVWFRGFAFLGTVRFGSPLPFPNHATFRCRSGGPFRPGSLPSGHRSRARGPSADGPGAAAADTAGRGSANTDRRVSPTRSANRIQRLDVRSRNSWSWPRHPDHQRSARPRRSRRHDVHRGERLGVRPARARAQRARPRGRRGWPGGRTWRRSSRARPRRCASGNHPALPPARLRAHGGSARPFRSRRLATSAPPRRP